MNPLESYGVDNPDFVQARMEEKAKEEERINRSKEQIIEHLKYSKDHYHIAYTLAIDWLKNFVKTGNEELASGNYKDTLEKSGEVSGKKINLNREIAKDILKKLISNKEFERLFGGE